MGQQNSIPTAQSFDELKNDVEKAKKLSDELKNNNPSFNLTFSLSPETSSGFFFPPLWKVFSRVTIIKASSPPESEKRWILTCMQFYQIVNKMNEIQHNLTRESLKVNRSNDEDECIICMERKAEVVLACNHAFCQKCTNEWSCKSQTCPYCRTQIRFCLLYTSPSPRD
eukprot:TRINITY_DN10952_c0_g1_i1.p1 TRINITY_DN10952_c0_g1~~TRINITY_DN10952_c0_g1_i1.p1  ORF type:complete len:169 (-),score=18.08 TRINITY_DN10952_c0_g1_i1:28-534(-)